MKRFEIQTKLRGKWVNFFKSNKTYKNQSYAKKIVSNLFEYQRLTNRKFELRIKSTEVNTCKHCGSEVRE